MVSLLSYLFSSFSSFSYIWYVLLVFPFSISSLSALKLPEDPVDVLYFARYCWRSFWRCPIFVSCEAPLLIFPLLKEDRLDLVDTPALEDLWSSKVMTSSSSITCSFLPFWPKFVSRPMFVKSIKFLADLMACCYFLAIISILQDWAMDHPTSRSSSLISSTPEWKTRAKMNSILHMTTIKKSSLFQHLFWSMYFLNPIILTLHPKSIEIVMFRSSSTQMKSGDSAILNPFIMVKMIKRQPIARSPM